jgi:predicted 3-demethylubiquinone-9 3-methyltransferase (glyoxalase superfamily)
VNTTHYPEGSPGPAGTVMTVEFEVNGQRFIGINGGPQFTFDEAISSMMQMSKIDIAALRAAADGVARPERFSIPFPRGHSRGRRE